MQDIGITNLSCTGPEQRRVETSAQLLPFSVRLVNYLLCQPGKSTSRRRGLTTCSNGRSSKNDLGCMHEISNERVWHTSPTKKKKKGFLIWDSTLSS